MPDPDKSRERITVFYHRDAEELGDEMMPREPPDQGELEGMAALAEVDYREGLAETTRVLFREPGEKGMSLVYVWFKSGYILPFHSHDSDCLYCVIGGELRMGSHRLRKGDGFFLPAGQGYGYEAGPDGVELLEFRNATRFNIVLKGNSPSRWQQIADLFLERQAIWADEAPPSER